MDILLVLIIYDYLVNFFYCEDISSPLFCCYLIVENIILCIFHINRFWNKDIINFYDWIIFCVMYFNVIYSNPLFLEISLIFVNGAVMKPTEKQKTGQFILSTFIVILKASKKQLQIITDSYAEEVFYYYYLYASIFEFYNNLNNRYRKYALALACYVQRRRVYLGLLSFI